MPIAIIIALLIAGGVSVAAGSAQPNDALYGVKVNVNEKLGAALSFGAEARAEHELRLTDRRLQEAETLAARGELDTETRVEIEESFKAHATMMQEHIRELEVAGKTEAVAELSARFQQTLLAHESSLTALMSTEATSSTEAEVGGSSASATSSATVKLEIGE